MRRKRICQGCRRYFRPKEKDPLWLVWCKPECAITIIQRDRGKQIKARKRSLVRAEKVKKRKQKREFYEKDIKTRREAAIAWFNKYIRLRDARKSCISCGASSGTFRRTAGHFITAGSCTSLRFDERNVYGQCWWNCNRNRSGNITGYRKGIMERFGKAEGQRILDYLEGPQPIIKITAEWYKDIEIKYKAKCLALEGR